LGVKKRGKRADRTSFGVRVRGRDPTVPCDLCGAPTERARLYELAGSAGDVMVMLRGVPCRLCPDDAHPPKPSSNDFEAKLAEAIFSSGEFPMAKVGRLGRPVCTSCGKRMKEAPERAGEIEAKVRIDGADIEVTVTGTVTACPRCDAVQIPRAPESARGVQGAIDHALARGGLR
jgi:predicted RNA-binding Zn-ribbon protein involved in translation (DUF1610 family)